MLSTFLSQLLAEFVGTFLFVLTIPLASLSVGALAPLAIGFMLTAMIFTFAYISGGHFNPAISFAVFLNRRMSLKRLFWYVVIQLLGAFFAALYGSAIVGLDIPLPERNIDALEVWRSILSEVVFTFALASIVLHVCHSRQRNNEFYGFAIGMTMMSALACVGGYTRGSFNPAMATGTQLVTCIGGKCKPLRFFWVYWIGPIAGALLAAVIFQLLDTQEQYVFVPSSEKVY